MSCVICGEEGHDQCNRGEYAAQKIEVVSLRKQRDELRTQVLELMDERIEAAEESRQRRHHDAVLVFVKHRLEKNEPVTGGELATWAHLMADYLYPPPGAVFDPPLRHYANPPPKPGEVDR
jgi:hypothetical protein